MAVCVVCGVTNPADRWLCRGCGRDLDGRPTSVSPFTGVRASLVLGGRGAGARWPLPRQTALALAGVLVAVAFSLLVLAWAGAGPFAAREPVLEPVEFPAAAYGGEPEPLQLSDVATLTVRPSSDGRSYGPQGMVDGDPGSAWHGDPARLPDGGVETVDLVLEQPAWVSAVVLANGDHASAAAYADAGWAERVELTFDGGQTFSARLLDVGRELQIVELDEPVLTRAVRITIRAVQPGADHPGPAISDVGLLGHVADDDDAGLARERAKVRPADGAIALSAPTR